MTPRAAPEALWPAEGMSWPFPGLLACEASARDRPWEMTFHLRGEACDLEDLAQEYPEGDVRVWAHPEGFYCLDAPINPELPSDQALHAAAGTLAEMNAFMQIRNAGYCFVEARGIVKVHAMSGARTTLVPSAATGSVRIVGTAEMMGFSASGEVILPTSAPAMGKAALQSSADNEPFRRALYLFGQDPRTWSGLALVLEAIADGFGGLKKLDKAHPDLEEKPSDIRAAANSHPATRHESRHSAGRKDGVLEPALSFDEARKTIRKLWGDWAIDLLKHFPP